MNETIMYSGIITFVKFEKDNFIIADFKALTDEGPLKMVIKGTMYGVTAGENILIYGKQAYNEKYGFQFEVDSWKRMLPSTEKQAINFLSSNLIQGCGKALATRIVSTLGKDAVEVIYTQGAQALYNIKGISESKAKVIALDVKKSFELQEIIKELQPFGMESNTIIKIYNVYQGDTLNLLKRNPYLLMDYDNKMNFSKVDEIALRMKLATNSTFRISKAIQHTLTELCFNDGHSFIECNVVFQKTIQMLNHQVQPNEMISYEQLVDITYLIEATDNVIVIQDGQMYLKDVYKAENNVSTKVARMLNKEKRFVFDKLKLNAELLKYQKKSHLIMSLQQKLSIYAMFENQMLIITGQAGTGKTTTLKSMIDMYEIIHNEKKVVIAAPTGRARKRVKEVTGIDAFTIHQLLEIDRISGKPAFNKNNPLPYDILFIDEFSMVGIKLASMLLDALKEDAQIVIFGDVEQLPSVEVGNVLSDLLMANVPNVELKQIYRQEGSSQIIENAHRINEGRHLLIDMRKNDFFLLIEDDAQLIQQKIVSSVLRFKQLGYGIEDITVLSPQKKGAIGTVELNCVLQEVLNPKHKGQANIEYREMEYRIGDYVMNLENDNAKNLSNGDVGFIVDIRTETDTKKGRMKEIVECEFDGRLIKYEKSELSALDLAYCRTVHKSQGSESPIVIMPVSMQHKRNLTRNLFYTGMTRTKSIFVMVGTFETIDYAIQNDKEAQRKSTLTKFILKKTELKIKKWGIAKEN
ncbi:ATP-dependent RecD-like DNA helicase [Lysinibacillus fusiformis]|uniref:SF1B family DNA helicase RecD2 n=1 Tax=Lysinibacillus fusiformis TaxID=28031 RepID=UPI002E23F5B3|nr:ATP-dependent RecD-like DNA helicase [Lysinibacillus fusiformis]MED4077587.1 ATP-dependent RecD-like DNA helicase [Lysinibacillus fusiformis]